MERLTGVKVARGRIITQHEKIRRLSGLSVTTLAGRTGFSHPYVSMVEGCRTRPSARYRAAAAEALDVPESVLFPETEGV